MKKKKDHGYEDMVFECTKCKKKEYIKNHGAESIAVTHFKHFEEKYKRNIRTLNRHHNLIHCSKCKHTTFKLVKFSKKKLS